MQELRLRGGGRVGWWSATWPLARLIVTANRLELNVGFAVSYVFAPGDIVAIHPDSHPFGRGIRIEHRIDGYSKKVEFSTFGGPPDLLAAIAATGFGTQPPPLAGARPAGFAREQARGAFPFKWAFVIGVVVGWNGLLLPGLMQFVGRANGPVEGLEGPRDMRHMSYALGFLATVCLLLLFVEPFRQFALKEGHTIAPVRPVIWFTLFVTTVMLVMQLSFSNT